MLRMVPLPEQARGGQASPWAPAAAGVVVDEVAADAVAGGFLEAADAADPALALAAVLAGDGEAHPFAAAGGGMAVAELGEAAILVPGGDHDR